MNRTSLIVTVILVLAIGGLYVLHFIDQPEQNQEKQNVEGEKVDDNEVKIAYVKIDSIILNYDLAQDLHDEFTRKQEAYTNEYASKRSSFEKEAQEFQEKLNRGGFLTEQRAISERDRLLGKEQEIIRLDQELSTKLTEIQTSNNQQLLDSVISFLNLINENYQYDYILNAAEILIGDESKNLTREVLTALNEKYSGKSE